MRTPARIASTGDSPSRFITGPLPFSGGSSRYAAVSRAPTTR
jgi:hypothetical protein